MSEAMNDRPEYVVCIQHPSIHAGRITLCNKPIYAFTFTGLDHAYLNELGGGRLLVCPECSKAGMEVLQRATWSRDETKVRRKP